MALFGWFLLIRSGLTNRHHFLAIGKHKSAAAMVAKGVPQGPVPGLILFIIFTTSLCYYTAAVMSMIHSVFT